jgi:hydroxypyruvate isomerase
MFREHPILDRFAAAAAAGFAGVEIQYLAEGDPQLMARAARAAGTEVALVNIGVGDFMTGGLGLSGVPGREAEFRSEAKKALDAAQRLGARHVHIGPSRRPDGRSRAECLDVYRGNVGALLDALSRLADPPRLLVEAMNQVEAPTALFADIDAASEFVAASFPADLDLLLDLYHTAMNGRDALADYRRYAGQIRHVQFADVPGRHEPGTGQLDLAGLVKGLRASGYDGWLGAEYRPVAATSDSLFWLPGFNAAVEDGA